MADRPRYVLLQHKDGVGAQMFVYPEDTDVIEDLLIGYRDLTNAIRDIPGWGDSPSPEQKEKNAARRAAIGARIATRKARGG